MGIQKDQVLYDTITSIPSSPVEFIIGNFADRVIINTSGTSTTQNISFKCKYSSDDTSPDLIQGFNPTTCILASSTTNNNETWIFDGSDWIVYKDAELYSSAT